MKTIWDCKNKFYHVFNQKNGMYYRSGVFDENEETSKDPFMASFPNLIDVGIMGHCKHAHICPVGCYQGGMSNQKENMSLEDYKRIVDESVRWVFQIALGGHGDPNKHENFEEIIKYTREHGIVPNYTTSGFGLTDKEVELTKKYCGAVAVSWYRHIHTKKAIEKFINAGCITNIHYVLSKSSIDEAISILVKDELKVNAVIFLLHKPVGAGTKEEMLQPDDPRLKVFFKLVESEHPFQVGFDSCTVPGLVNHANINFDSVDTCEGSKFSCYISSDMIMTPCSFDQQRHWGVDLKKNTIQEAWDSEQFNHFRLSLQKSCPGCSKKDACLGGCPIVPEIVLCNKPEKRQFKLREVTV